MLRHLLGWHLLGWRALTGAIGIICGLSKILQLLGRHCTTHRSLTKPLLTAWQTLTGWLTSKLSGKGLKLLGRHSTAHAGLLHVGLRLVNWGHSCTGWQTTTRRKPHRPHDISELGINRLSLANH